MDMHKLTRMLHIPQPIENRDAGGRRAGRAAVRAGWQDGTGNGPDAQSRSTWPNAGVQGASIPVCPGITPGSGPGHLGLFGYDPLQVRDRPRGPGGDRDRVRIAARRRGDPLQFLHARREGNISDRRAGRIPTEESAPVGGAALRQMKIPGVEIFVEPVKEHRFVVVFRGEGLGGDVARYRSAGDGRAAAGPRRPTPASRKTVEVAAEFWRQARKILRRPAARPTSRRCVALPASPTCRRYEEVYGLRAAAIAVYPMYKGLARLVGMTDRRPAADAGRNRSTCLARALEGLRFLLRALQVHRQHGRGWRTSRRR